MLYRYGEFSPHVDPSCFIAPSAALIGRVVVKANASIWFNTILRGDINSISIGENSNIQDTCVLHVTHEHKVFVEDRVTVGHRVILHGCHIESDCLIGMGAIVLDGAIVKQGSLIAAGAVVSPNAVIPKNSLVMGIPGKVIRELTPEERERFKLNWQSYVEYGASYKDRTVFDVVVTPL